MRIEADYEEEEGEWLKNEARKRGLTISQFLRVIALDYHQEQDRLAQKKPKPRTKRERFLQGIRETNSIVRTAHDNHISQSEIAAWHKDPGFVAELKMAQAYWIDGIQEEVRLIGIGKKSGDSNALSRLLAAHHVAYGRAKFELVLRVVDPLIKRFVQFLKEELGQAGEAGIQRALDRLNLEKRRKLSSMT